MTTTTTVDASASAYLFGSLHSHNVPVSSGQFVGSQPVSAGIYSSVNGVSGWFQTAGDYGMSNDPRLFMDPKLSNNPILGYDPSYFGIFEHDQCSKSAPQSTHSSIPLHHMPHNSVQSQLPTSGFHSNVTSAIPTGPQSSSMGMSGFQSKRSIPTTTPTISNTLSSPPIYSTTTTPYPHFFYPYTQFHPHSQFHPYHYQHTHNHGSSHHQVQDQNLPTMKQIRLDFPVFGGEDPLELLNRAEQFFQLYQIPEEKKISIASMHLTGIAASLWQLHLQDNPSSWSGLVELMMQQFGGYNKLDYQAALAKMQQVGTVTEFRDQFTKMSCRAPGFSPKLRLACFIGGLKEEIRTDVSLMKPSNLMEAFELSKAFEARNSGHKNWKQNQSKSSFSGTKQIVAPPAPVQRSQFGNQSATAKPYGSNHSNFSTDRKYSQAEYRDRRNRKQCFFCDEPYTSDHICNRGARALLIEGFSAVGSQGEEHATVMEDLLTGETMEEAPLISLHVLSDVNKPETMQLKGQIGKNRSVHILVDCGATHNFVHPCLLKYYTGVVDKGCPLNVRVASGEIMKTRGYVSNLQLDIQGQDIEAYFYILPVSGCEGVESENIEVITCEQMTSLLAKEREAMLIELRHTDDNRQKPHVHPKLKQLVEQFSELFQPPTSLPPKRSHDHRIPLLPGTVPVNVRPYRYPYYQKTEIEKIVREMLAAGVIQPSDKFPIPVIDELLDEVGGFAYFTKLDLRSGYHQIRMESEDVSKTAFRTHDGHYEFLVMPFGLTNAPSTFQSLMNDVFRDMLRKYVLVFFDDILIYSSSLEEHIQHLSQVFTRMQEHNLKVKMSKCTFGADNVEYLGHIVSAKGVAVDPNKIKSIVQWVKPRTMKGLRGFLGLAGYYRKYVKDFGIIAKPLTDMLKKDGFKWSPASEKAFEDLKVPMTTTLVLALPNFTKDFTIECDASDLGIGAVLSQDNHPISFLSKVLAPKHRALSVYDKEMMAVVFAVQQWRPYLLGHHFNIITDHRTIQHFLHQRITTPTQQKWLIKLIGYDYTVKYRAGKNNVVPDVLSRQVELNTIVGVSSPISQFMFDLQNDTLVDPEAAQLIHELQQGMCSKKGYSIINNNLYYKGRMFVPLIHSWRDKVLNECHAGLVGGHSGYLRTYKRVTRTFMWPGVKKFVKKWVAECDVCQRNHYEAILPPGLLLPLAIPERAWQGISMDFIEGLPNDQGKSVLWVIVDRFSKYVHFIPISHPYTAKTIAELFVKEIFRLHGMPEAIVTNRDPIFLSQFWEAFFKMQGTKLHRSTAYHPESDGQTENLNRTVEQYLRCMITEKDGSWVSLIPWAEFWYNSTYHSAIQMSPFEALYGYPPPKVVPYLPNSTNVHDVDVDVALRDRDEILARLKLNLEQARARMKSYVDKHRTEREFEINDWVYLKLQSYKQQSVKCRHSNKLAPRFYGPFQVIAKVNKVNKLAPRFYGPFQVIAKVNKVAYKLLLTPDSRVHPVFHVSLLKKKVGANTTVQAHMPPSLNPLNPRWYPAKVLGRGIFKKKNAPVTKWLIQWVGASMEDATWMEADEVMRLYPADFKDE
ncbi:uncharacterized protein LOC133711877 [Rosa rugosa]|uniref:uncharacterized protein LOC133711877 n=1 Tax=Rosa rugosa TaxID=74645 RepID=UPI002B40776C|nr:uncharacterized protein LOC133711877 [Rosa rugosa]